MRRICTIAAGVLLLLFASAADAVIIKLVSIKDLLSQSSHICTAKIETVDPNRPAMVVTADVDIKGKVTSRRWPINLKGDSFAAKLKHTPELLKRIGKDVPLVVFLQEKPDRYIGFAFTEGTWFQLIGQKDGETVRWSFTHCEPYFRRTFKGTTAELRGIVEKAVKDNTPPPAPDEKAEPGFGPELKKKEDGAGVARQGTPLFGVIVALPGAGIIGALALLFPAVFGGMVILMRRWAALVGVVFTNSTLFSCYILWKDQFWWTKSSAVWTAFVLITLAGALWAWLRHLRYLDPECTEAPMPPRTERLTLSLMSGVSLAGLLLLFWLTGPRMDDLKMFLWIIGAGFWAGTLYVLLPKSANFERRGLTTEGLVLCFMAGAAVLLTGRGAVAEVEGPSDVQSASGDSKKGTTLKRRLWQFTPPEQSEIDATPLVAGRYVYVGVIQGGVFEKSGRVYCLDRSTGKEVWRFDNNGKMKQMFSSPCIGPNGYVYIGEGFHQDTSGCNLYCLDGHTGKKLWAFDTSSEEENKLWGDIDTNSHVESSPVVANGRVFFGAGDKGLYALDAVTGKKLWQYPTPGDRRTGLHLDGQVVVEGDRVYCTSGKSQTFDRPQVFCVEAATGKKIWAIDVELPVWGAPAIRDGRVYVGVGNGRVNQSDEKPRGGFLCLDAFDGRRLWDTGEQIKDAVHSKPVFTNKLVLFGSRDGNFYGLDRAGGKVIWKRDLGSPTVSAPALLRGAWSDEPGALYVAAIKGDMYCLDPQTGEVYWHYDELSKNTAQLLSGVTAQLRRTADGDQRRIYCAATVNDSLSVIVCLEDEWIGEAPEDR